MAPCLRILNGLPALQFFVENGDQQESELTGDQPTKSNDEEEQPGQAHSETVQEAAVADDFRGSKVESSVLLTLKVSDSLRKKIVAVAADERMNMSDFGEALLADGLSRRAWDVIDSMVQKADPNNHRLQQQQHHRNQNPQNSQNSQSSQSRPNNSGNSGGSNNNSNSNRDGGGGGGGSNRNRHYRKDRGGRNDRGGSYDNKRHGSNNPGRPREESGGNPGSGPVAAAPEKKPSSDSGGNE